MKKIFAILMVVSILGVIIGGCSKPADDTTATTGTASTTGTTGK